MQEAALKFGDGATLPFTPCKKGYQPFAGSKPMCACPLHDEERRKRVKKEAGVFRKGEVDLNIFWTSSSTEEKSEEEKKLKKEAHSEEGNRVKKEIESQIPQKDAPGISDAENTPAKSNHTAKANQTSENTKHEGT